jgi:cell wall-associated NlpC family hydrolase
MNDQELSNVLATAGFKGKALQTAFGIAKRESGGRPDAFNPDRSTGDQSYGLFQINMLGSMGPSRRKQFGLKSNEDLLDPIKNAKAAYRMSQGGKDFGAWGIGPNAYRSGAGLETIAPYLNRVPKPTGRLKSRSSLSAGRSLTSASPPRGPKQYTLKGGTDITKLAEMLASGVSATEAIEGSTTMMEMVEKIPRLPKPVAEGKARQYGGTVQDFGPTGASNPAIARAINIAKQQIGKPYVWAAASPGVGFDCSGLIEYAYEAAGIKTPGRLTTGPMAKMGAKVPWKQVQPGDWIVRDSGGSGHVVMYVGNGQVIAAPRTGEVIQYQPLSRFASDKRYAVRRWHG